MAGTLRARGDGPTDGDGAQTDATRRARGSLAGPGPAGARRGAHDDDSRPRRRAGSARAIIPPLGGGVRREDDGLEAPLLDGGDGCDVSSVEPSLVSEEDDGDAPWAPRVARPVDDFGPESVFADAHDDDLDGARMEDDARSAFSGAETRRAAPIPVPSVPRRLLAKYTGTLASYVIVATSLAAKNLLAYPVLAYALVSITSRPKHGAFARRHGPLILVYLAVWCVTEYAYISVPDAVLPEATHRRGQLLRAVGLYRVDADRADAAGPGYIGSLFVTLAAAAALLNQARMTPTEEELEEALRAVGGGGLPPGFVRLDAADDDKPPPPATFERGDDADARGGAAEEAAAYASASANGGTAEEVAAAAYASANAAAARRGRRANVVEPAVPGWERPALAVLSNLLVPLALWIVALSNDDLLHAALLLAFLLTLVWPGDRSVLANTGRVIAGGLALMYLWSLDSIPDLTGINRPEWKPALRLLGLWQPDLIRAMIPMACILVINCVVLNLPEVVEALQPLEDEDAEAEAGIAARTAGTATARAETEGVTAEAVWALVSAAAAEVWLTAVALADGGGAYGVLLLGLCIVEVTDCCLLNLALLGLLGFALIVPMPSNPKDERNSPRWRALLGFALANLAARYAFGAYPLARSLGLPEPAQRFLHRTVGLAPNLPGTNSCRSSSVPPRWSSSRTSIASARSPQPPSAARWAADSASGLRGRGEGPCRSPSPRIKPGCFRSFAASPCFTRARCSPSPRCISACDTWTCSARRCSRAPARSASRPRRRLRRRRYSGESPSPRRLPITPSPCAGCTTRR